MASHSASAEGPFPAWSNALCNPVRLASFSQHALVREGARNLVVILTETRLPDRKISPADETGCLWGAPDGAISFHFNDKAGFSIHEPAHTDVHYNPQRQEHEQY